MSKKKIYTIIVTEENDVQKIEKAVIDQKIKDYEVYEKDSPSIGDDWTPPQVRVYTDRDSFMRLVLKLNLNPVWI